MLGAMRRVPVSLARAARVCWSDAVLKDPWQFCLCRLSTSSEVGDGRVGAVLIKLTNIHQRLAFAIEGAQQMSASANLAFLERDPTQRGPRAQFEVDAAVVIRDNISAALRDAKRVIGNSVDERLVVESEEVLARVRSLELLVQPAEEAVDDMRLKIMKAHEKLAKLGRGFEG